MLIDYFFGLCIRFCLIWAGNVIFTEQMFVIDTDTKRIGIKNNHSRRMVVFYTEQIVIAITMWFVI